MKNFPSPSLDEVLNHWAEHNALPNNKATSIRQAILAFETPTTEESTSEPLPTEWWVEFFVDLNQQLKSVTHHPMPSAPDWAAQQQNSPQTVVPAH